MGVGGNRGELQGDWKEEFQMKHYERWGGAHSSDGVHKSHGATGQS